MSTNIRRIRLPDGQHDGADYASALGRVLPSLPYCLRVIAENAYRNDDDAGAVARVARRDGATVKFKPTRLLLQDMLGLPLLTDLMALRDRVKQANRNSNTADRDSVDLMLPTDLVIDHSMTVAYWANQDALALNMKREFEVNRERFEFMKACEQRFLRLRVVPPGGGIMHQVNLEYLATVVSRDLHAPNLLVPDTNLGTDSHTPMINSLGVLGWGIGGLEAEALMLGECTTVNVPRVIGLDICGTPAHSITATDIALRVAQMLREIGVVDCFVELFGPGYGALTVADRGTIANMAPEYGATAVYCPPDQNTIEYLKRTGRPPSAIERIEGFCRTQALWVEAPTASIEYDAVVPLNLGNVRRSVAGPERPHQRIDLADAARVLVPDLADTDKSATRPENAGCVKNDDVIVAAITSCTNTANPRNMVLAGLVARNAWRRGLRTKTHVKTSFSPGSRVVSDYLTDSGLQHYLDALGFHVTGFSCSTCNGMSGPLRPDIESAIHEYDIDAVAVLSGNRNFSGRIHPLATRNVLASPPLVVAYALCGTVRINIESEALGVGADGAKVFLSDLWPTPDEVNAVVDASTKPARFRRSYDSIATVNPDWNRLRDEPGDGGAEYNWPDSDYISFPPYIACIDTEDKARDIEPSHWLGLRPLVILGDAVTTDHISPSGTIDPDSAAGRYLLSRGVKRRDFNSYGTRRGAAEIVVRSTFANPRLRNEMTKDRDGSWTMIHPEVRQASVFDAIEVYRARNQGLVVVAGKEYGAGSSRDTAAKAPWLAGIRAVVAESFERIHRSNLVNMGIAPLTFTCGVNRLSLGLTGAELFDISLTPELREARLTIRRENQKDETIGLDLRLYNDAERTTFKNGGLLSRLLRQVVNG